MANHICILCSFTSLAILFCRISTLSFSSEILISGNLLHTGMANGNPQLRKNSHVAVSIIFNDPRGKCHAVPVLSLHASGRDVGARTRRGQLCPARPEALAGGGHWATGLPVRGRLRRRGHKYKPFSGLSF